MSQILRIVPLLLSVATASSGATFFVTKESDDVGPCTPDDCALREAVLAANAASGADVIEIPGGEYLLTVTGPFPENDSLTGDLDLRDDVEIRGDTISPVIIRGKYADERVLETFQANVVISHVTITGGNSLDPGGGLLSQRGSLELRNCTVSGNHTESSGGGLFLALNSVRLSESTISGNSARFRGGGIHHRGSAVTATSLDLVNVTISGNSADSGGGIDAFSVADRSIVNSTISGNEADVIDGVLVDIISSNAVRWTNTLIEDECGFIDSPGPASGGGNIESPGSTCFFPDATDQMGVPVLLLGPLADNGGPTMTHALLPGSPALDAGVTTGCPATDQRGFPRPRDGDVDGSAQCDVGAFELGPSGVVAVPVLGPLGLAALSALVAGAAALLLRRCAS